MASIHIAISIHIASYTYIAIYIISYIYIYYRSYRYIMIALIVSSSGKFLRSKALQRAKRKFAQPGGRIS